MIELAVHEQSDRDVLLHLDETARHMNPLALLHQSHRVYKLDFNHLVCVGRLHAQPEAALSVVNVDRQLKHAVCDVVADRLGNKTNVVVNCICEST